jgi:GNAT superfamily N-acetyltransferase
MTAADIPAGLELCRQAGWNQLQDDWTVLMAPPSVFRVAEVEGRTVGTAGAVVYGDRLAWVCMVLVEETHRGQGLASSLMGQVLERLPAGLAVGLDATPKGQPVYARMGFEPAAPLLARLESAGATALPANPPEARPVGAADLAAISDRDRDVFGADRSRILRSTLAAAPAYAWCVERSGRLAAYAFGRMGKNADQIGPVVADDVHAALAAVAAGLRRGGERRFFLDAPAWPEWREALATLGFREQRPFTRMYRRGQAPRAHPEHVFAITGPEFG